MLWKDDGKVGRMGVIGEIGAPEVAAGKGTVLLSLRC